MYIGTDGSDVADEEKVTIKDEGDIGEIEEIKTEYEVDVIYEEIGEEDFIKIECKDPLFIEKKESAQETISRSTIGKNSVGRS
ncbi:hypothetical protein JTB14_012983 [Gonioctena quinquepunctata]|nr:hypothetical protein JTB14_012983 [Gonioctena quinquepunctata]